MNIVTKILVLGLLTLAPRLLQAQAVTSGGLATSPVVCDKSAAIAGVAGANMVKIITKDATKPVYVCTLSLTSAGTAIGVLKSGTLGTQPCDTSTVAITGAINLVAGVPFVQGSNLGSLFKVAAGLDVCILTTTTAIGGFITYAQ